VPGEPAAPGDRGSQASTTLCRVGFAIGALAPLLDALAWATSRTGARGWLRGSAGVGSAMLALEGDPEQVVAVVGSLRERAEGFGGSVVVLEAPGAVRSDLDVWGPVRGLSLMRSVKAQFDPARRLAPGRFVGGI
jgi:glycolate oxidase FAD binding subunit